MLWDMILGLPVCIVAGMERSETNDGHKAVILDFGKTGGAISNQPLPSVSGKGESRSKIVEAESLGVIVRRVIERLECPCEQGNDEESPPEHLSCPGTDGGGLLREFVDRHDAVGQPFDRERGL